MIGLAAGLSASGLKPLVHSFGSFASRRCFDQAFLSVGYAKNNVLIIGSDAGVTAAYNGGTHMPFEDVALYRTVSGATVIDITDSVMLDNLLPKLLDLSGLKYVRFGRKEAIGVYAENSEFDVGKSALVREGGDVTLFASGIMVSEALKAAEVLQTQGISATILDMYSIKPLDEKAVITYAKKTGAAITAENHNIIGGLGSAVADVLIKNYPVPLEMVGVQDEFGEVGPQDYLQIRFGLTAENIVKKVERVLSRRNGKIFN